MSRAYVFAVFLLILPLFASGSGGKSSGGPVAVRGYVKSNGTYVQPHMRSAPDGNFYNNWSTVGNVNPYTGVAGSKTSPSTSSSTSGSAAPLPYTTPTDNGVVTPSGTPLESPHSKNISPKPSTKRSATQGLAFPQLPPHAKLTYLGND